MTLEEGQIYEGTISLSGADGPMRRWIVVAPFGKRHLHSIDDPTELHCLPLGIAQNGIRRGKLRLVSTDPNHPVVQLQRAKERLDIQDSHLGLYGRSLDKMFVLLQHATATGQAYTRFAAGEILAHIRSAPYGVDERSTIEEEVHDILGCGKPGPYAPGQGESSPSAAVSE